jgi:hypothetical protein
MSRYGAVGAGTTGGGIPAMMGNVGTSGGNAGVSSAIASLVQNILASNAAIRQNQVPQINPQAVRYGLSNS